MFFSFNVFRCTLQQFNSSKLAFFQSQLLTYDAFVVLVDWWRSYGGRAIELQRFAKRVVSLCASSSGCERCWSTFNFVSILVINNFYLDAYNLIFCFASHLIFCL